MEFLAQTILGGAKLNINDAYKYYNYIMTQSSLKQSFHSLKELLENKAEDPMIFKMLSSLSDNELTIQLPSLTNWAQDSYTLMEWFVLFERLTLIDYLVKRLGLEILYKKADQQDALSFAIKNSKYLSAQHLLNKYSSSFDLIGKIINMEPFLKLFEGGKGQRSVCYLDLLDYSHLLEQMFKNQIDLEQAKMHNQTREMLIDKSKIYDNKKLSVQIQAASKWQGYNVLTCLVSKLRILLKYHSSGVPPMSANEIAKYMDFDIFQQS